MSRFTFALMVAIAIILNACGTPDAIHLSSTRIVPDETFLPTSTKEPERVVFVNIHAPSLTQNLLAESDERTLIVYLPPSYATSQARYPVVYYLPGFGDLSMLGVNLPMGIDKEIGNGTVKEMIVVIASGVNALGGSFYVNSPVTGNWDDFITRDVVSYVDANYRTIRNPDSRGISGHAMGGYGALNLAMLHPDVFGAVYSISPDLFDPNGLAESQIFSTQRLIDDFVDFQTRQSLAPVDKAVSAMKDATGDLQFALAYGAAFAPAPLTSPHFGVQGGPPYIAYPYQRQNGRLFRDDSVWKRWEAGFGAIPDKIQTYKENLLKLNSIVIDYGANDQYRWLPRGCEYFSAQLTAAGIPNQLVSFPRDHRSGLEQRIRGYMLPFFSQKLVFDN